jgi:protein SCO1/2
VRARLAGALLVALLGCRESAEQVYLATGTVERVDPAARQVVIAHDDVPELMPAMTMSFDVRDPRVLEGVGPGDRVSFELVREPTGLWIRALIVDVPSGAPGAGAPLLPELDVAPEFALVDQDGREARLADWRGSAVLLDFVFTRCPGPCPIQTARLVGVQKQLPAELAPRTRFASVSLDPEYDTPERLREYAAQQGADLASWSFLTGEPAQVQAVLDAYGIGTVRKPDGALDHVLATYLIGPDGRVAKRWIGLETKGAEMLAELERLLS